MYGDTSSSSTRRDVILALPKAEAASNNAIARNCPYASVRFFRATLGPVVLDPSKALRASRIFFDPGAAFTHLSASAWVSIAPFASISLCRTVVRSGRFRTWRFRFDGERGKLSKNVGLRQHHEETGCLRLGDAEANQFRNFEPHPVGC